MIRASSSERSSSGSYSLSEKPLTRYLTLPSSQTWRYSSSSSTYQQNSALLTSPWIPKIWAMLATSLRPSFISPLKTSKLEGTVGG